MLAVYTMDGFYTSEVVFMACWDLTQTLVWPTRKANWLISVVGATTLSFRDPVLGCILGLG
jgi:hypothetical protein